MTLSITLVRTFAAALTLVAFTATASADDVPSPHAVIDTLADRLYVVGETTGSLADFDAAMESAVAELRRSIERGEANALTARDEADRTPLSKAAGQGYAPLVAVLLGSRAGLAGIDATDSAGLSAWDHANIAYRRSMLVCRPAMRADPFRWIPMVVTSPWYRARAPYRETRRLLERAGAAADIERPRRFWLDRCDGQSQATRERVATTADLLETLITESDAVLDELLRVTD